MKYNEISQLVFSVARLCEDGATPLGTAFLINQPGILVTAAHVVGGSDSNLVIMLNNVTSINQYQDTSLNNFEYVNASIKEYDPIRDICILEIPYKIRSSLSLGSSDLLNVGDNISLFGYPHCNHGRVILTQHNTSIGAKILFNQFGIKTKNIVLNFQAQPGQSGSPIISENRTSIDAILIGAYSPQNTGGISIGGINPQTLHQTTHAVSAHYIKEML